MTKKDRIAVVLSLIYALLLIALVLGGLKPVAGFVFSFPIYIYWGYRFIRNDISFIGTKS